jgi:hypothetical protein
MQRHIAIAGTVLAVAVGIAWASGDWSAAKDKAKEYKSKAGELKKTAGDETRKIVREICSASDDDRKSAASSAASFASGNVRYKFDEVDRLQRDANDQLDRVINDDNLKDQRSEARDMQREIRSHWEKLSERTRGLRDSRPEVVEFMLDGGERARRDRTDRCTARHVAVGSFAHADCIQVRFDTCEVISVTSDSSRAISAGKDKASRMARELEQESKKQGSDVIKRLIDSNSDFARCKRFEGRVDCYHLCPDIDEDGKFRRESPSWREGCS